MGYIWLKYLFEWKLFGKIARFQNQKGTDLFSEIAGFKKTKDK